MIRNVISPAAVVVVNVAMNILTAMTYSGLIWLYSISLFPQVLSEYTYFYWQIQWKLALVSLLASILVLSIVTIWFRRPWLFFLASLGICLIALALDILIDNEIVDVGLSFQFVVHVTFLANLLFTFGGGCVVSALWLVSEAQRHANLTKD